MKLSLQGSEIHLQFAKARDGSTLVRGFTTPSFMCLNSLDVTTSTNCVGFLHSDSTLDMWKYFPCSWEGKKTLSIFLLLSFSERWMLGEDVGDNCRILFLVFFTTHFFGYLPTFNCRSNLACKLTEQTEEDRP